MDFPLSWILRSPSVSGRLAGLLDGGAGSFALRTCPHFRHVLTRSSRVDTATQHGAFPLRSTFWVRPASLLVRQRSRAFCSDPVPECRVGGGRAFALPPSARSNGSCGFPASRFPVWSSPLTGDDPDPRHQMDQPDQSELVHQTGRGITPPRRVPPSLGDEGEQASLDPTVETVEQGSDIRLPIVVPPAA